MKRALIIVFASLLAVVAIGPAAAQGRTKYHYWQDLSVSGPFPGQIFLTVAYRDRHGNGKFTPRYAAAYRLRTGVSCTTGDPGDLLISGNEFNKYGYFRAKLSHGRFTHRFENQAEQPQASVLKGVLNGKVLKQHRRGNRVTRTARVSGAFNVEDWDPAPGTTNCTTSGSYSATSCKRWMSSRAPKYSHWKRQKAPVCRQTW
ncbi:MAG: hypothetical protein WB771_01290 [Solirubrobacterales bacterium]